MVTHGVAQAASVRSVERALGVLELLEQHQALGLEELHYLTFLPKATLSRLLLTLQTQGWVYRGLSDRRYRVCARRLFDNPVQRARLQLVECAAPWLVQLSEHTGLVADLSCFDGERLEVMESAVSSALRRRYPRAVQVIGQHASLFHSAMGQACLFELAEARACQLLASEGIAPEAYYPARDVWRQRGFGQRTEGHWEYSVRLPFLIRALALPIRLDDVVVGSVGLHWPRDRTSVARVASLHLDRLAETICQIQRALV